MYTRAVVTAVGLYIASFVVGLLVSSVFGLEAAIGQTLPLPFLIVQCMLSLVLGFLAAWWYFRAPGIDASAMHGLTFGGFVIVVSFVLDFLLFIPAILNGYPLGALASLYGDPWFWAALALLLVGTTAAGFLHARTSGGTAGLSL